MTTEIRIYVADLAAYNAGHLHGVWIDVTDDLDSIQEQISAMLADSPVCDAEEYAIHDYEGFGGYELGEYEGLENAHEVACFIEQYPDFGGALLSYYCDIDEARKIAKENYCGCYASIADYAQELTEDTSEIPSHLEYYIDYERMSQDMELNGGIFTIEIGFQEVHIFWNS